MTLKYVRSSLTDSRHNCKPHSPWYAAEGGIILSRSFHGIQYSTEANGADNHQKEQNEQSLDIVPQGLHQNNDPMLTVMSVCGADSSY
jgi:hypothetical protein